MFGRHASFPRWFNWLWLAAVFLPIVDLLLVVALTGVAPAQLIDASMARHFAGAVVTGLWVWYMHVSVRVRNTFTN